MREAIARSVSPEELALLRAHGLRAGTVLERDGAGTYGFGRAVTLALPLGLRDPSSVRRVSRELRQLASPSSDVLPLALGALPFRPDGCCELVVPTVTVTSRPEGAHAIVVSGPGAHEAAYEELLARAMAAGEEDELPPDSFELYSVRSHDDFLERVSRAVDEVRSGRLDKIVLAREVVIEANRYFRTADLLERLRSLHPSCLTFQVDGFLGASPELLVRRRGHDLESEPLAGTAPRSGDPEADRLIESALLSSEKERSEHRAVVEAIASSLAPVVDSLEVPPGPKIVELRNVSHLATPVRARLDERGGDGPVSVLEALSLIHPTPAVSGSPIDLALEYLQKAEEMDRGRYAGAVGFIDGRGDGEFYLGIRSAVVEGRRARLYAGVGIVADSDPKEELRETQLKLQAVLAATVRP